jgi:DNA-binding NarL/FixJ family response regulator
LPTAITAAGLPSRILVLTTYDSDTYLYQAIPGWRGRILFEGRPAGRADARDSTVAAGDTLLHPTLTRRLLERFTASPPPGPPPTKCLGPTEREAQVLSLVGQDLSNREIADALFLGESTVKTHLNNLMRKLDLRDRVRAVVFAYESGLIRPGANPS